MRNRKPSLDDDNPASLWRRIFRYEFAIISLVFFFSGLVLIILGEQRVGDAGRDIGISLVIAGTVALAVEYLARKEAERVLRYIAKEAIEEHAWPKLQEISDLLVSNNLRALGVKEMYINRSPDLLSYIQQAPPGSTIKLLAISLNRLAADGARTVLRNKLREGCTVQALVIEPASEYVRLRALEEMEEREDPKPTPKEIEQHVKAFVKRVHDRDSLLRNLVEDLPCELQARIEIRHYDMPAYCFLMDNDRTMLVGFYLRGYPGEDCPHIELDVRDGGAYLSFRRHFDSLWRNPVLVNRRKRNIPVEVERRHPPVLPDLSQEVTH